MVGFRQHSVALCSLVLLAIGMATGAQAQTLLLEARGGIAAHDVTQPGASLFDPNRIRDANAELLLSIPNLNAWALVGELRPHVGVTFNTAGQGALGYAGLSWTVRAPVVPIFVEAGLGAAVHSAAMGNGPRRFGCAAQLEAQASAGLDVLPNVAVMGTLQHFNDFGACGQASDPLTTAGVRLGVRF